MKSQAIRRTAGTLLLALALGIPATASAQPLPEEPRTGAEILWDLLVQIVTESHWQIDPDGILEDGSGGDSDSRTENRWQIDPNG